MVCVTSKTNGQEVQPEKEQYLQNIYSEELLDPVYVSCVDSIESCMYVSILIDEPVYLKDVCSVLGLSITPSAALFQGIHNMCVHWTATVLVIT